MASLREQILARIATVLATAAPGGAAVYRSRQAALSRADVPAIIVTPSAEITQIFAHTADRSQLDVDLIVIVRGDPYDQLADAVAVPMHAALIADFTEAGTAGTLGALCSFIRRAQADWAAQEADLTAGEVTLKYQIEYLSDARDITRPPLI